MGVTCLIVLLAYSFCIATAITQAEFNAAVTSSGFRAPPQQIYNSLTQSTSDFSREELAMFIAQLLHESVGFRYTEELGCSNNRCRKRYSDKVGLPEKSYHGRGYIQLTFGENYKKASKGLGKGDLLLRQPELVASDKNIAMQVSVYYWRTRVRRLLNQGNNSNLFGITTKAINGHECKNRERAERRWKIYLKVANALHIANKAKENGCYN
ncbi:hypothetical protein QAD02_020006 [Eretmocerus hayati]|uniref:Uncharacterized protein n=1 Tax=Eretmocerus hayati TaxID=131215 RepID=A0ACC2PNQ2_9HYME|nr:hypothetical protein QAD02_020006 [Eretmocerus hayati]